MIYFWNSIGYIASLGEPYLQWNKTTAQLWNKYWFKTYKLNTTKAWSKMKNISKRKSGNVSQALSEKGNIQMDNWR